MPIREWCEEFEPTFDRMCSVGNGEARLRDEVTTVQDRQLLACVDFYLEVDELCMVDAEDLFEREESRVRVTMENGLALCVWLRDPKTHTSFKPRVVVSDDDVWVVF